MSYDEKKLDEFSQIIFSETNEKIDAINKEIEEYKTSQLTLTRQDEEEKQQRFLEKRTSQIHAQIHQTQTKMQLDAKRELIRYRNELLAEVFSNASKRLAEFAASDKYKEFLQDGIKSALSEDEFDLNSLNLLIKPSDEELAKTLAKEYGIAEVKTDNTITLGGFKLVDYKKGILSDNTLETMLSEQKKKFLSSCELKINE